MQYDCLPHKEIGGVFSRSEDEKNHAGNRAHKRLHVEYALACGEDGNGDKTDRGDSHGEAGEKTKHEH